MPKPAPSHKSMPNLWLVGTLEDGLSLGTPWHPWGGPQHPRPGEWNVHRDALAHLGKFPLLLRTLAQPYESCSNDEAWVPAPQPVSQTRAQNLG